MKRTSIFLIALALIVCMPGCFTPFRAQYQLTISSTEGGNVTTPGEGIFTYWEGTVVNLTAEANECRQFTDWTGNVSTMGDINAASTNITMNCDYSITANFAAIPTVQYQLAINSTEGGHVTVPGEGVFTYDEGTIVNIMAEAYADYQFVQWTGNVSTVADVYGVATNITMSDDCQITANFESMYYADYSGILDNVLISLCDYTLEGPTQLEPPEGEEHGPLSNYSGAWPPAELLSDSYWEDVKYVLPYDSDTLDVQDYTGLGPLYRDGTLEVRNTGTPELTIQLNGTLYVTADTMIGMTYYDFILDINGQTIFVESATGAAPEDDPCDYSNGYALKIAQKCTLTGSGCIIAVGNIEFKPNLNLNEDDFVLLMSVNGQTYVQPNGDYYGALAGSAEVRIVNGVACWVDSSSVEGGLNFPYTMPLDYVVG